MAHEDVNSAKRIRHVAIGQAILQLENTGDSAFYHASGANDFMLAMVLLYYDTYVNRGNILDSVQLGKELTPFWRGNADFKRQMAVQGRAGRLRTESGKVYPPMRMRVVAHALYILGLSWGGEGLSCIQEYLGFDKTINIVAKQKLDSFEEWWISLSEQERVDQRTEWDSQEFKSDPDHLVY